MLVLLQNFAKLEQTIDTLEKLHELGHNKKRAVLRLALGRDLD